MHTSHFESLNNFSRNTAAVRTQYTGPHLSHGFEVWPPYLMESASDPPADLTGNLKTVLSFCAKPSREFETQISW